MANSTLSKVKVSYDRKPNTAANVAQTVVMTLNGNTLSSIANGATPLVADTDYTVADTTTVTILKAYLDKFEDGTFDLTFTFSADAPATLTVEIYQSAITDAEAGGYTEHVAADPLELKDDNVEQCPNCHNAVLARKAGMVDHCHYCGQVLRNNN